MDSVQDLSIFGGITSNTIENHFDSSLCTSFIFKKQSKYRSYSSVLKSSRGFKIRNIKLIFMKKKNIYIYIIDNIIVVILKL